MRDISQEFISLLPYWAVIFIIHLFFRHKAKDLAQELIWASIRTTVQLILLAFALKFIFATNLFIVTIAISFIMTLNSAGQIVWRNKSKVANLFWISFCSNLLALWPVAFLFSLDLSQREWWQARNLLPLLGMLLGNTLNGVSISLESFIQNFRERKNDVLTLMALGASIDESSSRFFFRALRAGITPQINAMISMGIISIPGMMAGQLIAGTDALAASMIQVKMMLAIVASTVLSVYIALYFVRRKLFLPGGELC